MLLPRGCIPGMPGIRLPPFARRIPTVRRIGARVPQGCEGIRTGIAERANRGLFSAGEALVAVRSLPIGKQCPAFKACPGKGGNAGWPVRFGSLSVRIPP